MNDFLELRKYIVLIARRWWLVLLLTVTAAGFGYGLSLTQDRVYRAMASVMVGQSIQATQLDSRDIQTSQRLALTYADIARRQPVLEAVVVALDLDYPWQTLRKRVAVEPVADTQLLEISADAGSRAEAVRVADELARQLVLLSPSSLQNQEDQSTPFLRQRLADLQAKIEDAQQQLGLLADELATAQTAEQRADIQEQIRYLEGMIIEWENIYARFTELSATADTTNDIAIIDRAHAQPNPVRPSVRLNAIVAGALGFVLALAIILVLAFLDDTLKTVDDITHDLKLTPLGVIGKFKERAYRDEMIVSKNPFSPAAESYRIIRNNIQFVLIDKPKSAILVTSPSRGDGKSTTSANLAIAMAINGRETVIVDSDLRKPVQHRIFRLPSGRGLTNQLRDPDADIYACLQATDVERLRLLPSGALPPNPSELLGSRRMETLIDQLMQVADVVIFDSPPAALLADAATLSKRVDGVVLVISAGKTRRDETRQAISNLKQSGATILGAVLNRSTEMSSSYGYGADEERGKLRRFRPMLKSLSMRLRLIGQGD